MRETEVERAKERRVVPSQLGGGWEYHFLEESSKSKKAELDLVPPADGGVPDQDEKGSDVARNGVPDAYDISTASVYVDNQGAIETTKNGTRSEGTKHIGVASNYGRELLPNGIDSLSHCPTNRMTADILTNTYMNAGLGSAHLSRGDSEGPSTT